MRNIKFRGKRVDNGEWVYGYFLYGAVLDEYVIWTDHENWSVDPETVGQFTDLRDKNSKEIYEGDILKQVYRAEAGSYDDRISFEGHHIGSVVITASKGVCMKNPLCYSIETDETNRSNQYKGVAGYRCEVIGNIYENPELLQAI